MSFVGPKVGPPPVPPFFVACRTRSKMDHHHPLSTILGPALRDHHLLVAWLPPFYLFSCRGSPGGCTGDLWGVLLLVLSPAWLRQDAEDLGKGPIFVHPEP